ncbi:hypothetical protein [Roseomonas indoligenes]|uniref:Uncharacterized protein n=1 Tax=Roseomonas indoligenes TaxID=2820811 RepID=A0A940N4M8_9PROT|nr:hypothetical protein [Pararoseomonas indoligenes]MBP0496539.1 hypothetical protein [Pararoseomonas indoligenes]
MPPELRLSFLALPTTTDRKVEVSILDQGRYHPGRVLKWSGGVYQVELPDPEVVKLLRMLSDHYVTASTALPVEGRRAKLVVEVLLEGEAAEGGRRIAEACRLLGLALGRIEQGEAQGLVADQADERRVAWRLTAPVRGRGVA